MVVLRVLLVYLCFVVALQSAEQWLGFVDTPGSKIYVLLDRKNGEPLALGARSESGDVRRWSSLDGGGDKLKDMIIFVEASPFSLRFTEASFGVSVILYRNGSMIRLSDIKTGIQSNSQKGIVAASVIVDLSPDQIRDLNFLTIEKIIRGKGDRLLNERVP